MLDKFESKREIKAHKETFCIQPKDIFIVIKWTKWGKKSQLDLSFLHVVTLL